MASSTAYMRFEESPPGSYHENLIFYRKKPRNNESIEYTSLRFPNVEGVPEKYCTAFIGRFREFSSEDLASMVTLASIANQAKENGTSVREFLNACAENAPIAINNSALYGTQKFYILALIVAILGIGSSIMFGGITAGSIHQTTKPWITGTVVGSIAGGGIGLSITVALLSLGYAALKARRFLNSTDEETIDKAADEIREIYKKLSREVEAILVEAQKEIATFQIPANEFPDEYNKLLQFRVMIDKFLEKEVPRINLHTEEEV